MSATVGAIAPRLIMLYGASPGAGKTTLATALIGRLRQRGIDATLLAEEAVLHLSEFVPVVRAFQQGEGDAVEACLQAARAFVQSHANGVTITDSIFPCFTWLFAAGYSPEAIAQAGNEIATILKQLQSLLVYLDGDVHTLLHRAVAQRGDAWLNELIADVRSYGRSRDRTMTTIDHVVQFFEACRETAHQLLVSWPDPVFMLDVNDVPPDDVSREVADQI